MITNRKSDLSKHLRSMYRRAEKPVDVSVLALTQRFVAYAKQYNSVTIQDNPLALSFLKK
jgi:chromatin segregation and condensation protein Rec8/ScpA/Scc1 (kleisin family)